MKVFGNLVSTSDGVGISFGSWPLAFVSVQVIPSAEDGADCEASSLIGSALSALSVLLLLPHPVKDIATIASSITETFLKRDIFTPTRSLLAVYWLHLTRLDLLRAPH